jgi:phosphohistidine swiveling domain-containing protein
MVTPTTPRDTYQCEDGTDFPVDWPTGDAPNFAWRWNEDHHPVPLTPLMAALDHGPTPGGMLAYEEANVVPPHMFRGFLVANGFQYARLTPLPPEEMPEYLARAEALAAQHGGPAHVWAAYSLPRVREACERLRSFPADTPVADVAFCYDYAFQLTQVGGPTVLFPPLIALKGLLTQELGPEGSLLADEVTQGGMNATIESDQAIWEMAQLANADRAARDLLDDPVAGLATLSTWPAEHPFRQAFEAYLETYRWRGDSWDLADLTLGEQPHRVLAMVRAALQAPAPAETAERVAAARRAAALARVETALSSRPEPLGRFRALDASLEGYVGVREGRALWQLTAVGCLRHAMLAKGAVLVQRGLIDAPDDVLFLLPDEVDRAVAGAGSGYRDLAGRRRTEWEFWKSKRPPHQLGAPLPAGPAPFPLAIESTGPVLRGIPASRGVVTAPVRVLRGLDEADSFQPGEILVCAMTSPPWTPLFAIAAAVVTDSGAPLSHPAIAAREYGIPCVVGAKDASRKLQTGEVVTVDGAAGTVTRSQS